MKKKATFIILIFVTVTLLSVLTSVDFAKAGPPILPHQFWGTTKDTSGQNITDIDTGGASINALWSGLLKY